MQVCRGSAHSVSTERAPLRGAKTVSTLVEVHGTFRITTHSITGTGKQLRLRDGTHLLFITVSW